MPHPIRIGIGGWTYEPWRGPFYPEGLPQKRELEFAAARLTAIEINGTYYGSQKPASFIAWRDAVPDGFVFALKGPRFTTNRRELATAGESIQRFLGSGLLELGPKLGPINWQFMEHKAFDPKDFAAFLDLLPATHDGHPVRHTVEVRHPSFACAEFVQLTRDRGIGVVLAADSPHPLIADPTAGFAYLRIMGTREGEPLGYPVAELDTWADRARAIAAGHDDGLGRLTDASATPREVFLFVIGGHKVANPATAQALIARVRAG